MLIHVLYVSPNETPAVGESLRVADERFSVDTETTAERALSRLSETDYECVVSRYDLPDGDGVSLLREIKETHPELPFILYPASGSEQIASDAISADVTEYLTEEPQASQHRQLATLIDDAVETDTIPPESQQRHRFERMLEAVPSSIIQVNSDGEFIFANNRAEQVLGLEKSALTDRTYNDPEWEIRDMDGNRLPEEELPFRVVKDTGEPVRDIRHTVQWPDGTERFLSVSGAPLFRGDSVDSVVFSLTDITDRQQYHNRLARLHQASRELYEAETAKQIAETTSQAAVDILDFQLNGVHLYDEEAGGLAPVAVSDTTEEIADKLITFDRGIAWEAYQRNEVRCFGDVRTASEVYDSDTDMRTGLYFPLGDHGVLILTSQTVDDYDKMDRSLGTLLAANATSALDRIERESVLREQKASLTRQNKRLEQFANVVSHDVRNPLNVARGRVAQLDENSGHKQAALDALDRIEAITDDVLTLARVGDSVSDVDPVSLSAIATDAWSVIEHPEATLTVESDCRFDADSTRLQQLFENLFRNAIEHGGSTVTVQVGAIDDAAGFYVADDGTGIPESDREKVFESGYSTNSEGTGLGLDIVKEIVDGHDWAITVTASRDGGARFEVTGINDRTV